MITDTYDGVVSVGLYVPKHANEDSFGELVRIVKPGKWQSAEQLGCRGKIIDRTSSVVRINDMAENSIIPISVKMHEDK